MLNLASANENESGVISLRDYIAEQAPDKPYRFVVIHNEPENMSDDSKAEAEELAINFLKAGRKLGLEGFKCKIEDSYLTRKNGKIYIHDSDDASFLVDENTVVFNRSKSNDFANWKGMLYDLEESGAYLLNSLDIHLLCADKWRTYVSLKKNGVKQPETLLINNPTKAVDVYERLGSKFPIILKTQLGTGGVGVLLIENEKQLLSNAQLITRLNQERGMIIQEQIPLEYDIRVIVINGEIHGAMKRPIVDGDFRSNVHQGSKPELMEITELEKEEVMMVAEYLTPRGYWLGIDLIPSNDRENERPYVLEVNTQPGTFGYNSVIKTNIFEDVLKPLMNRDNWT